MISAYDARQYKLLRERCQDFLDGRLGLPSLINDVEALLCVVEHPDLDWLSVFKNQWAELEIEHALALDENLPVPTASSGDLRRVVQGMLDSLPSEKVLEEVL